MNDIKTSVLRDNPTDKLVMVLLILATTLYFSLSAAIVRAEDIKLQLPERKQTTLGLYVTARQAYEIWKAAPKQVKIVDVRTPEEYAFIGHPEMVWNIPFAFVTYQRKDGKTEHGVKMNDNFVAEIKEIAAPTDLLILMCRSGDRSARAVNLLSEAGFKNAYTITDGMEGDKITDPANLFFGKRMKNGWKNSGLPWVYTIDTERILIPEG